MKSYFALLVLAAALVLSSATNAREPIKEFRHRGMSLVFMPPPPAGKFDIDIIGTEQAEKNLVRAIDRVYAASRFSTNAIEKLKNSGNVTVVYDAEFPKKQLSSVTIAAFFPDYFQKSGPLKEFLVVVGRFGVKWPTDKLAAVIVHELAGHGLQHLRGRTDRDRKIDRECEALLFEEGALQDLGVDRRTSDMVRFRADIQKRWCADFRRYMLKREPRRMALWNYGTPDVPELLKVFERYLAYLRETGVSGRAVAAAKAERKSSLEAQIRRAALGNDPQAIFDVAHRFLKGIGTKQDIQRARHWFSKAAHMNHPSAQLVLGSFMEQGVAGPKDRVEAFKWYALAAAAGNDAATSRKRRVADTLSAGEVAEAERRVANWTPQGID